jgi:hypothetical protein
VGQFPFSAAAEMFSALSVRRSARMSYRRFETAAEAIRFAMEDLPAPMQAGTSIQVGDQRLSFAEIAELFERAEFPGRARPDI